MTKLLITILLTSLSLTAFGQELDLIGQWQCYWHLVIDDQDFDHRYSIEKSSLSPTEHVFQEDGVVKTTIDGNQYIGLWSIEENLRLYITYRETKKTLIFICSSINQDSFVAIRVMGTDPVPYFDVCLFEREIK